ncbi:hypothetical protein VTG60DRAFT_3658 [Thermothelomyces hinnuleus]
MRHLFTSLVLLALTVVQARPSFAYTPLSDASLRHLPRLFSSSSSSSSSENHSGGFDPDFDPTHGALLAPILRPRVPGTPGHAAVQEHFAAFARDRLHAGWAAEWHNTTSATPATGDRAVPFRNLVLRRDPPWTTAPAPASGSASASASREGDVARLTLAAHYDSLYRPEGFVGAVDSAVPCALLLFVARAVDAALTRRWEAAERSGEAGLEGEEKGLQILLLDGEEAWVEWSERDSLYGSR